MQYFLLFDPMVNEAIVTITVFCPFKSICTWSTTKNSFFSFEMLIVISSVNVIKVKLVHMFYHIFEIKHKYKKRHNWSVKMT